MKLGHAAAVDEAKGGAWRQQRRKQEKGLPRSSRSAAARSRSEAGRVEGASQSASHPSRKRNSAFELKTGSTVAIESDVDRLVLMFAVKGADALDRPCGERAVGKNRTELRRAGSGA
jgi:hypothetical protein